MNGYRVKRLCVIAAALCYGCTALSALAASAETKGRTISVKGSGMDLLNGAIVHSTQKTLTGQIKRSTEIVELNGDLHGRVLYEVTTVIDEKAGTLTNHGDQVFAGTIAGSEPVMIHDSHFRFDVNLKTGKERGVVYLTDHIAGPPVQCELQVIGTGMTHDGNPTFKYAGSCTFNG